MATRNPILDTRMSGPSFNWNLVSCLIGLMNYAEVKVRWWGARKKRALVRKEKTDGAQENCRYIKDSIISLSIHHQLGKQQLFGDYTALNVKHSRQKAEGASSASGL